MIQAAKETQPCRPAEYRSEQPPARLPRNRLQIIFRIPALLLRLAILRFGDLQLDILEGIWKPDIRPVTYRRG